MDQAFLISQIKPKNQICVKCGEEIEGMICWRAFKWSALRFFIWLVIWIPSLFFLQYQIGIVWAIGIGMLVLMYFIILLQQCHQRTQKPRVEQWEREQRQLQERDFERFIREYENKI